MTPPKNMQKKQAKKRKTKQAKKGRKPSSLQ